VSYEAVVFDLGGVVFPSPLDVFRAYERDHGLPHRFLSEVVLADPEHGAWSRLERGELNFDEFCDAFDAECAAHGTTVSARELMDAVRVGLDARPEMVTAITAIRRRGLKTAALTNNWADDPARTNRASPTDDWFDVMVESAVEGLRKPDPRIYALVCERLDVSPPATVFLDDLGANLKPARELGMTTIKVAEPEVALAELGAVLGFELTG
jgi:putative hydrolase of the HAD superfamily